jgi:AcrR family transcriptional regulator
MGRWQPDAQGRLAVAALELYGERGFEQTTVAEIAARAGLTERTFFRQFADKREVLFAGSAALKDLMLKALDQTPESSPPISAVAAAIEAAALLLQQTPEHARARSAVIAANVELQERELIKMASLSAALTEALSQRGVTEPGASLAAEAGIAVFRVSFERWVASPDKQDFPQLVREAFADLKTVTGAG